MKKNLLLKTILVAIKISFLNILVEILCKFNFPSIKSRAKSKGILSHIDTISISETEGRAFGILMLCKWSFKFLLIFKNAIVFPELGFKILDKYFDKLYVGDRIAEKISFRFKCGLWICGEL